MAFDILKSIILLKKIHFLKGKIGFFQLYTMFLLEFSFQFEKKNQICSFIYIEHKKLIEVIKYVTQKETN